MKKLTKTQRIKEALLMGKTLTGNEIITNYQYLPYRNIIYILRNRGLDIDTRLVGKSKYGQYSMSTKAINKYQSQQRAIKEAEKGAS